MGDILKFILIKILKKMQISERPWTQILNIVKMLVLLILMYRFNTI